MKNNTSVVRLPDSWESNILEENKYLKEFIGEPQWIKYRGSKRIIYP